MAKSPPIRALSGNLVLDQNSDAWAVFRVRCRSYRSEPFRRKAALAGSLAVYARQAEADFQVLRVARHFDAAEYLQRLRGTTSPGGHHYLWNRYLEEQFEALDALDAWTPEVFVSVRLANPSLDLQARAARIFERTPGEAWRDLRGRVAPRHALYSRDVKERASIAAARVRDVLDGRAAYPEEVQWLVRRAFCRGVAEPPGAPAPETEAARDAPVVQCPPEEPDRSVVRWFGEYGVDYRPRYLRSFGDFGESYQAALFLGELGHARAFSRQSELMFSALEEHPYPVDAALNFRFVPNDQALRRVGGQFARNESQREEEETSARGELAGTSERGELAREFHARLSDSGEPMLEGTLSFMLSATSHDELERRVRAFRDGFPWPLYRPYGNQLDAWKQHFPGQPVRVSGFTRMFTVEQVGAMVPHATHEAGSSTDRALYVAKTLAGRQPTFLDLREGSGTNKAPTIALLGSLGGGKTFALQLLLWQAFIQGARIVDVDPKGDHRFHALPAVAPCAEEIYLGPQPEHAGKLDPLRVAPPNERHDAAATFLVDVLPPVDATVQAAISGAIARVIENHGERACCMEVVAELDRGKRSEEKRAGYLLGQYCRAGIVRLGFGQLTDPLPSRAAKQVTYLQIRALKRADVETVRSEMSQSQRHGRAVLQLVALYAMKILGEDRDRLKVLAFDETSFIAQDAAGQQLLDILARWGRSEFAVPIFSTQLLRDVADQDNLVGHWFLFAMRSREHAVRALEALELDASGPLPDALTRYENGMALYRDLRGRSEEIQVDMGIGGLLEALSTTPVERGPDEDDPVVRLATA